MRSRVAKDTVFANDSLSAPVAQWIRASDYGSEGRRFESCRAYQLERGLVTHQAPLFLFINPALNSAVKYVLEPIRTQPKNARLRRLY